MDQNSRDVYLTLNRRQKFRLSFRTYYTIYMFADNKCFWTDAVVFVYHLGAYIPICLCTYDARQQDDNYVFILSICN